MNGGGRTLHPPYRRCVSRSATRGHSARLYTNFNDVIRRCERRKYTMRNVVDRGESRRRSCRRMARASCAKLRNHWSNLVEHGRYCLLPSLTTSSTLGLLARTSNTTERAITGVVQREIDRTETREQNRCVPFAELSRFPWYVLTPAFPDHPHFPFLPSLQTRTLLYRAPLRHIQGL